MHQPIHQTAHIGQSPERVYFGDLAHETCGFEDCDKPRSERFTSIAICDDHALVVVRDYNRLALGVHPADLRIPHRTIKYDIPPQVYYLTIRPGVIKIGFTRYLLSRLKSLRHPVTDLLATEPGGRGVEAERHRQFADERITTQAEDFRLSDRLAEHIRLMRATHDTILTRYGVPKEKHIVISALT
jgi:hypothetical protein